MVLMLNELQNSFLLLGGDIFFVPRKRLAERWRVPKQNENENETENKRKGSVKNLKNKKRSRGKHTFGRK